MNHTMKMFLGCTLPLLLVFLLPLVGFSEGVTLFVAILLMFACHLLMIGGPHQADTHVKNDSVDEGDFHAHS